MRIASGTDLGAPNPIGVFGDKSPGTEAGSGACFVKFAGVSPGQGAPDRFEALLDAIELFAAERGFSTVTAGVNTARHGGTNSS